MRVVMNQLAALGLKTGIGHYTAQLLRCLQEQQVGDERVESFPTGWLKKARQVCAQARPFIEPKVDRAPHGTSRARPGHLARLRTSTLKRLRHYGQNLVASHFRKVCARKQYDLYHEPNCIALPSDCPTVTTLHDLSVLLHPEWHPADRVAYYHRNFQRTVDQCVHFLTVSEFSRQEMIQHLGIPPERITRVYNGIRPELSPLPREEVSAALKELGLPPRYLLYVGTIEPRKNILLLLKAYCALPHALRERWPLLLVGSWGWNAASVAEYLDNIAKERGVIHVGYLPDQALAAVYNGARALVYPSLYEGFGLPPMEMMACGGAVLASTAGALAETVGDMAHLIPPDDLDAWSGSLTRILQDDDWWLSLKAGTEQVARSYTWDRCAAETLQVYRSVCGIASPSAEPAHARKAG